MSATLKLNRFELMWLFEGAAGKSHLRWDIYKIFVDRVYPQLRENEREFLYTYIKRDTAWLWEDKKIRDETPYEMWRKVLARYNPANQYTVTASHDGKTETRDVYLFEGKYYINFDLYFASEFVTAVSKKPFKKCANGSCSARNECVRYTEREAGDTLLDCAQWPCNACDYIIKERDESNVTV